MYKRLLHKHGLRATKSRLQVFEYLSNTNEPCSAEKIYDDIHKKSSMSLSTIYRTLAILQKHQLIIATSYINNTTYYQLNNNQHEHELICSKCQEHFTLPSCPLNGVTKEIEEISGFTITGHNLQFIGTCPDCKEKE